MLKKTRLISIQRAARAGHNPAGGTIPSTKSIVWYKKQRVGMNNVGNLQQKINKLLGIEGHKTNHSLRRTQATSLFQVGRTGEEVKERTGHKSCAVEEYMQTSNEQKRETSAVLAAVAIAGRKCVESTEPHEQHTKCDYQQSWATVFLCSRWLWPPCPGSPSAQWSSFQQLHGVSRAHIASWSSHFFPWHASVIELCNPVSASGLGGSP